MQNVVRGHFAFTIPRIYVHDSLFVSSGLLLGSLRVLMYSELYLFYLTFLLPTSSESPAFKIEAASSTVGQSHSVTVTKEGHRDP